MIRRVCSCILWGTLSVLAGCATKCGREVTPKAGQVKIFDLGDGVKLEMVWIEPGGFVMGSPEKEQKPTRNDTQHVVTLTRGYWLGKYEVTQAQWEAVMGSGSNPSQFKGGNLPVEQVSWDDCQECIRRLNAKLSGEGGGFRLPTEAEWEYACRAGTTGGYAGVLRDLGWYDGNSGSTTHPVGEKRANAWGIYDMHGNVWEWCEDWCGDYPSGSVTDPTGPSTGSNRVCRGGSWCCLAAYCRSARRYWLDRGDRDDALGFRLARTSPSTPATK